MMTKEENRAWFLHRSRKYSKRVYVMYESAINPDILILKQGKSQSLSGFKYELSSCYNAKKNNVDYLYKSEDKTVKFHATNTDDKNDKELQTWGVTCHVLEAIEKKYSSIILIKACLDKETNLLHNSSFEDEIKTFIFNVEKTKKATLDYLLQWDFLPNSTGLLLVNERALKVLEEVAPGEFQAFPTEIRMYDGTIIKNYKLINITNCKDVLNKEKSVLLPVEERRIWRTYEVSYYNKDCLSDCNLARAEQNFVFLASDKVRKAVQEAKLTGLEFDESWGDVIFIE